MNELTGDNLVAGKGAIPFPSERGEEIREVPFVYSLNLMMVIAELVGQN